MGGKQIGGFSFEVRPLAEGEAPARSRCLACGKMEVAGSMEGYQPSLAKATEGHEARCLACGRVQDTRDMQGLYQKSLEGKVGNSGA